MERIIALDEVEAELAMLRAPNGHGEIELVKFHSPPTRARPLTLQASATSPSSSKTSTP